MTEALLFSYGTLQDPRVQEANFGRRLDGSVDALPGYDRTLVEITDPEVIAESGLTHHPIVRPTADGGGRIDGTVFHITEAELRAADDYEVDDYHRILVTLQSGRVAWVYVARS
ncbi:gamma-glutamylcyclotransferase family protein [Brevundimonas sp.]|uniref:gamma-glutamylcyclotransferase family protein n=1 Tax=Brevundimonas sp. TaxID=1871086 RepID=UPI0025BEE454|nr:gamma-glutamylcyclotransferase family protein [Brevundimonas sp.]